MAWKALRGMSVKMEIPRRSCPVGGRAGKYPARGRQCKLLLGISCLELGRLGIFEQ